MIRFCTNWCLIAVVLALGCTKTPEKKRQLESSGKPADLLRVTWWMKSDVEFDIAVDEVRKMAKIAFGKLEYPTLKITRSRLVGELAVAEEKALLSLECRFRVDGVPFPVVAKLGATGPASTLKLTKEMLAKGLADAAKATADMLHVTASDPSMLVPYLSAPESDVQILAAKLIGVRKTTGATLPLCALLSDPRQEVAEAAAEALIALDEPSSIKCIIENISKESLRSEVRAIEIMGRIGGPEAVAYLEMTSLGHELKEVRRLSQTLLKTLRAHKKRQ